MQEYKRFRGGACLAISLEGLERLSKRKCNDQEIKKRDGRAQLWMPNSHVTLGESELQSFFCLCDCESRTCTPSSVCSLPALDSCTCRIHTSFSTTNAFGSPWTDLPNTPDNVNYLMKKLNCNPNKQIVILYNDNILAKLFPNAFDCRDSWPVEVTGRCVNNNVEDVFKDLDPDRFDVSNNKDHLDRSSTDEISKEQTDSYIWEDGRTGETSGRNRKKSVSFADDVLVFLYDKDCPTEEPRLESSLISEILFNDNDLEWEDDFLALEKKNCQSHRHPESTSPLPTQNWTMNMPKSFVLSQSCLFLTHVNESDLEV